MHRTNLILNSDFQFQCIFTFEIKVGYIYFFNTLDLEI